MDGRFRLAASRDSECLPPYKLPRYSEAASFDFKAEVRSTLLGMSPEDSPDALTAKLKSASALLFLGRAVGALAEGRSADLQRCLEAVLDLRGCEVLPYLTHEYDALRSVPPEPGKEEELSQRSKALFSLINATNVLSCT